MGRGKRFATDDFGHNASHEEIVNRPWELPSLIGLQMRSVRKEREALRENPAHDLDEEVSERQPQRDPQRMAIAARDRCQYAHDPLLVSCRRKTGREHAVPPGHNPVDSAP
jgi:hypothetical protein